MSQIAIDYRTQYEAAEARIRELEAEKEMWHDRVDLLEERIAKAKAILESDEYADHSPKSEIQRALDALEGK